MKYLLTAFSTAGLLFALSFSAPAKSSDVASFLAGVCENVASDNKGRFRKKLKTASVKLRNVYDGVTCGGLPLVRYAMQNDAQSVGTFIVKRMPGSHFAESGDLDWANANGYGDSKIAKAIASR